MRWMASRTGRADHAEQPRDASGEALPKIEVVMTEAQRTAKQALLADLYRKLEKRRDVAGFAANVADLERRIGQLEAELAA